MPECCKAKERFVDGGRRGEKEAESIDQVVVMEDRSTKLKLMRGVCE